MKKPIEAPVYNVIELANREKEVEEFESQSKTVFKMGYLGLLFDQVVISIYIGVKYRPCTCNGVMYVLPFEYEDGEAKVLPIDSSQKEITLVPLASRNSKRAFIKCVWIQYIKTVTGCYVPYHELPDDYNEFNEEILGPLLKRYNKKTFPQDYSVNDNNKKHHSYPQDFICDIVELNNNRSDDMYMSDVFDLLSDDYVAHEMVIREYVTMHNSPELARKSKLLAINEDLVIDQHGMAYNLILIPKDMINGILERIVPANSLEQINKTNMKDYPILLPVDWIDDELIQKYKVLFDIFMKY